jgi:hypothetical protein
MDETTEKERHPIRFLFKLTVFLAFLYFAARLIYLKKDEYYGLTESQARSKIEERLEPRIGADKATEVADQVIPLLKDRGVVKSDPVSEAASDLADTIADAEDDVEDAVESVGDAMSDAAEEEATSEEDR